MHRPHLLQINKGTTHVAFPRHPLLPASAAEAVAVGQQFHGEVVVVEGVDDDRGETRALSSCAADVEYKEMTDQISSL